MGGIPSPVLGLVLFPTAAEVEDEDENEDKDHSVRGSRSTFPVTL
jgi:hypothetical protein